MTISIDDFKKVEMKVGEIMSAEAVAESQKLLKLSVDFGEGFQRQVISGIASYFPDPSALVGKRCAFVTNLEPRQIMGLESQAMILAVSAENMIALFEVSDEVPLGTPVR